MTTGIEIRQADNAAIPKVWTPNPFMYDFGRAMPSRLVVKLFTSSQIVCTQNSQKNISVYEPAAGTGRIIMPLAVNYPDWHFTATDIAPTMLDVLAYKRVTEGVGNIKAILSDAAEYTHSHDMVILSSFLHAIPDWQKVLAHIAMTNLAPDGILALIGDTGDLYGAADGTAASGCDPVLKAFWEHYFDARRQEVAAPNLEAMQRGCRWDVTNAMPAAHLTTMHWQEVENVTLDWRQPFIIQDFITMIEQRCWSSMFMLPSDTYVRILSRLAPYFATLDRKQQAVSRHTATLRLFRKKVDRP